MRLTSSLALLALAFRGANCAAADKPADRSSNEAAGGPGPGVNPLPGFLKGFMEAPDIIALFSEVDGRCEFTKRLKTRALLEYPNLNVVVYSNLGASDASLINKFCAPINIQQAVWPQHTYRLCVFETGRFTRVGDDSCENWQCGGCAMELYGSTVEFCRVGPTTTPSRTATSKPTSKPTSQLPRTTILYGGGTRKSTSSTTKGLSKTSNKAATKTSTTATSRRPRGTTTQQTTTSSQPVPGTAATDASTPPPTTSTTTPPVLPPTSATGDGNAGASTTGAPRAAGSANEPDIVGVLAAMGMAFMAMA